MPHTIPCKEFISGRPFLAKSGPMADELAVLQGQPQWLF